MAVCCVQPYISVKFEILEEYTKLVKILTLPQ